MSRYSTFVTLFTVTTTDEFLETTKIYRFVFQAQNIYGLSDFSLELIVGLGNKPPAPANLRVELLPRQFSSFLVKWDEITVSDLPILGYVLLIDDGLKGDFSKVYDGSFNPQVMQYFITGLVPGRIYRLKVYATDVNGSGNESDIVE